MTKNKSRQHSDFPVPNRQAQPDSQQTPASVTMRQTSVYSGPIPPAVEMEGYHRISPDLVKQIMQMAVEEQQKQFELKRMDFENEKTSLAIDLETLKVNGRTKMVSLVFSFIIVLAFLALVAFLGYLHEPLAAGVVSAG